MVQVQVQVELQKLLGAGLVITSNKVSLHRNMMLEKQKNAKSKRREEIDDFQAKF